ncbi:MAG TPA: ribosome maturation factor RimM [Candidatus Limnocylindrales bacterium]|nr:ribosome maturation factor RimM [Candidatus Limnocylindrales bacterium]
MAGARSTSERLVVGLVRGLHGLRGAVRVEVLTDDEERFRRGRVLHVEGSGDPLTISWVQPDPPGLLVRFGEVSTRSSAERLRDAYLVAEPPPEGLPEGAYYWHEVEGATVTTTTGEVLGEVADVFRAGEAEVFTVRGGPRGEVLVPAVRDIVVEFAPGERRIVVDADALGLEEQRARRPRGRRSSKTAPTSGG